MFDEMKSCLAVVLIAFTVFSQAAEKSAYQNATLNDLQRYNTDSGAARAQGSFCLALQLPDVSYLVRQESAWRWSYQPVDFIVGDFVQIRVKDNDLYLKKPKGGEFKTHITRRERTTAKPLTCSLAVTER